MSQVNHGQVNRRFQSAHRGKIYRGYPGHVIVFFLREPVRSALVKSDSSGLQRPTGIIQLHYYVITQFSSVAFKRHQRPLKTDILSNLGAQFQLQSSLCFDRSFSKSHTLLMQCIFWEENLYIYLSIFKVS